MNKLTWKECLEVANTLFRTPILFGQSRYHTYLENTHVQNSVKLILFKRDRKYLLQFAWITNTSVSLMTTKFIWFCKCQFSPLLKPLNSSITFLPARPSLPATPSLPAGPYNKVYINASLLISSIECSCLFLIWLE